MTFQVSQVSPGWKKKKKNPMTISGSQKYQSPEYPVFDTLKISNFTKDL